MSHSGDTLTAEEYRRLVGAGGASRPGRVHKYGAEPAVRDGIRYASRAEARRAGELDLLLRAGEIAGWARQPSFTLGVPELLCRWDFIVIGRNGETWCEDVKGVETGDFKRNRRLWASYGMFPLRILKTRRGGGWQTQTVEPEPTQRNGGAEVMGSKG